MTNKPRAYQGKREDGTWDQFMWDEDHEPTPDETGYSEIEPINENSLMDDDKCDYGHKSELNGRRVLGEYCYTHSCRH